MSERREVPDVYGLGERVTFEELRGQDDDGRPVVVPVAGRVVGHAVIDGGSLRAGSLVVDGARLLLVVELREPWGRSEVGRLVLAHPDNVRRAPRCSRCGGRPAPVELCAVCAELEGSGR